uniref:Uncharacterized protein n=1 Tax=Oryza meridionalis TaxID=40149 RepID=A0A0E0DFK1_9ORYZ
MRCRPSRSTLWQVAVRVPRPAILSLAACARILRRFPHLPRLRRLSLPCSVRGERRGRREESGGGE